MSIDIDDVWSVLKDICVLEESEKNENLIYCAVALNEFSAILKENFSDRAVIGCGLLAFYYYCLLGGQNKIGDVAFEAGDVSVKLDSSKTMPADLKKLAYEYARDDIKRDMDFTFKAV